MILDLWSTIKEWFNDFEKFVEKYCGEPFFWIIVFLVLLVVAIYAIKELADK